MKWQRPALVVQHAGACWPLYGSGNFRVDSEGGVTSASTYCWASEFLTGPAAGATVVVAQSYARIFFRNCVST